MSSKGPDFREPVPVPGQAPASAAETPPAARQPSLEGILEQILANSEPDRPVSVRDQQIRAALIQVAHDHRTQPFSLDPVLYALVRVLTGRLQGLSAEQSSVVERSVAATLYEDVASRERIEKLWTRLVRLPIHVE